MIVRVLDITTDAEVHRYSPEDNARVPTKNDRVRVPANGSVSYIVQERHFDYESEPTVLTLYCLREEASA